MIGKQVFASIKIEAVDISYKSLAFTALEVKNADLLTITTRFVLNENALRVIKKSLKKGFIQIPEHGLLQVIGNMSNVA